LAVQVNSVDLLRLRSLVAPSLAALFVLLTLSVFLVQSPPATGIGILLPRLPHRAPRGICDGDWVFVRLLEDGKTRINGREINDKDLPLLVSKINETRAERIIFVVPYPGIPYSRFVETLSSLKKAVPDLHLAVLSGEVRDTFFQSKFTPCDFELSAENF
jgi:biopolymer transport protein ExbD